MEDGILNYKILAEEANEKIEEIYKYGINLLNKNDALTIDEARKFISTVVKICNLPEKSNNDNDKLHVIVEDDKLTDNEPMEIIVRYIKELRNSNNELTESVNKVVSLVEDNASSLSFSVRTKNSKGVKSPSYIKELDTHELVSKYIKADYKLTSEIVGEYQEKFGITYHGLRNRLIQAGVWKANH